MKKLTKLLTYSELKKKKKTRLQPKTYDSKSKKEGA